MRIRDNILALREILVNAAANQGARDLRLFGSVVRGDDTPSSDVDFLVTLEPGRTLLDLAKLEIELEKILGRSVDVVTEQGLEEPVRSAVLSEAVHV